MKSILKTCLVLTLLMFIVCIVFFGVNDEVLCHASKKKLLQRCAHGWQDFGARRKEARDSLNRWLEMLAEDLW